MRPPLRLFRPIIVPLQSNQSTILRVRLCCAVLGGLVPSDRRGRRRRHASYYNNTLQQITAHTAKGNTNNNCSSYNKSQHHDNATATTNGRRGCRTSHKHAFVQLPQDATLRGNFALSRQRTNAFTFFLQCSVDWCHVTTVEGVGSMRRGMHPVQKRIAEMHGSQCGFCTPGIAW